MTQKFGRVNFLTNLKSESRLCKTWGKLDDVELCVLPDFKELLWEFNKSLVGSLRDGSAEDPREEDPY